VLGFKGEQRGGRIPGGCSSLANVQGPTKTRVSADLEEGVDVCWRTEAAPAGCAWREGRRLDLKERGHRRPVWTREAPPSSLAWGATAVFRGKGGEEL